MGRPLFSRSPAQPTVRVEPEVTQPTYERWTYLNAFDPDSDEFFRDAQDEMPVLENDAGVRAISPIVVEVESSSSSSSEASTSGRATPVEEEEDPLGEEFNVEAGGRRLTLLRNIAESLAGETIHSNATNPLVNTDAGLNSAPNSETIVDGSRTLPVNLDSPAPIPITEIAPEPLLIPTSRADPIRIPIRPSTPPHQTAFYDGTPSPAPSVTPRIYTWGRPTMPPPSPTSPLPNRGARRSIAHIEEFTPFPVRRVVV